MSFLKKLRRFFSGKKTDDYQFLLETPFQILFPGNILEPLGLAISMKTKSAAILSTPDIKVYNIFIPEDNLFMGSFYAVRQNGLYFGALVGSQRIICFAEGVFSLRKSDVIYMPCRSGEDDMTALVCRFVKGNRVFEFLRIVRKCRKTGKEEVLHTFDKPVSFKEALDFYHRQFKSSED